jgi:DNA polymerase-3 subunit alpha (Gram-positive type)
MAIHFIDTETTGLYASVHEIIEIAIITEYGDGRVERWSTLIKPKRIEDADPKALEINGYDADKGKWDDAPTFEEVYESHLWDKWRRGDIAVGHNIAFDAEFYREECKRIDAPNLLPFTKIDTVTLAHEHLMPMGLKSLSLDKIRTFLHWSSKGAHTALKDAEDCRKLYWCLLRRQNHNNIGEKKK